MDFSDLLNSAIGATENPIVSEQHDMGKIDANAARLDVNELLKAGRGNLVQAAQRMAALDNSSGRIAVMVAGEPAWHKLGVNVSRAVTSGEAIKLAGLDWAVVKVPMSHEWNGVRHESADTFALVRADTGAKLNTVGGRYQVFQNEHAFDYLDDVLPGHGARIHTAGAINGGAKVWMQAEFPRQAFSLPGGDEQKRFVTLTNGHGLEAVNVFPTDFRIVCANTRRIALADKRNGLTIRHTGSLKAKVQDAQKALGLAVKGFDQSRQEAEVLYRKPLDCQRFTAELLDTVLGMTQAEQDLAAKRTDPLSAALAIEAAEKRLAKLHRRKDGLLDEVLEMYHSPTGDGAQGTAWGAYNAISESADHGSLAAPRRGSDEDKLSRRFESVLDGAADEIKQLAWTTALNA